MNSLGFSIYIIMLSLKKRQFSFFLLLCIFFPFLMPSRPYCVALNMIGEIGLHCLVPDLKEERIQSFIVKCAVSSRIFGRYSLYVLGKYCLFLIF